MVVDHRDQVTDMVGFLSGGPNAKFLYTCRCGWLDKSHLATGYKAAQRMYKYYKTGKTGASFYPLVDKGVTYEVVEAAGPSFFGFDDVRLNVVNLEKIPLFAYRDASAWISYGLGWLVEQLEADIGSIPGAPHRIWESAWSYEDPPSNWLGAVTFMKTLLPDTDWTIAVWSFLYDCVPMGIDQAQRLYDGMESYKGHPPLYHRDDSFKNYPPWNYNALLYLHAKDFFHTWVKGGPYGDCCGIPAASIPPRLRTPRDIYAGTLAHIFVSPTPPGTNLRLRVP
ncbi:MAG: hypothetical protein NT023_16280 [Armatimonadetes bacterium]|nr:hypothetical protein [Armatimonadota bacterium]